ncbi:MULTISPECIES: hypothetical protein [Kitasatospora]|uniref:Ig-like domain-containing protein n=1 Tax=Kitasatospora setae (strain ATCC 33774 / DSM 43861 / JCM 3304 / KCC A-0304 / NBRC 14216 / KM-6054) TaxID=452652 RepID=E4NK12_KITSK|nr:hypothetical protein [Kitasatospora setae]BAJ33310.1 hypothetical protein KSE_75570 [Kitasatospora setae KM-6054]
MKHLRTLATAVSATLLGLAVPLLAPAAAQASQTAGVDITCLGSTHVTYDPPITNTEQDTTAHITNNFSCTSLLTAVSSGSLNRTVVQTLSCLLAVTPPTNTATETYSWNTGQSSTATYVSSTAVRAADGTTTVTAVGAITSGLGLGSTVTKAVVIPQLSPTACATTGLSEVNGTASLVILPV